MPELESRYPLNPLVRGWIAKKNKAKQFKYAHFGEQAEESMKFYECGKELNDLMWERSRSSGPSPIEDGDLPAPKFRMIVGKTAEVVQLFGPALYHRNPSIVVEPKSLDIPIDLLIALVPPEQMMQMQQQSQMAQQQAQVQGQPPPPPFDPSSLFPPDPEDAKNKVTAQLINYFLDYIQRENKKYAHSRQMIDEALIKGAGVLWTEQFSNYEGGPKLIGSFYDTVDNLYIDPDAETLDDALYVIRECHHPVWQVAEEYGIDEDFLEKKYGTAETATSEGESDTNEDWNKKRKVGKSNDLITYWKIYSKMGMGHKLSGIKENDDLEALGDFLDSLGQNCYIVVADRIPYPLNLHTKELKKALKEDDATDDDESGDADPADGEQEPSLKDKLFEKVQWPIPFWADGEWPMTLLGFHEVPNNPWPMSHMKPALGLLKFLNWTMSFLTNKMRTSCRTVLAMMKGAGEEIKSRIASGKDNEIIEIEAALLGGATTPDIAKLVQFLQMPEVNKDMWQVINEVSQQFDKATGLTELAYGAPGGMRSAAEANAKQGNMNIRPDDMANKVEDVMSLIARKEAMAARWLLEPEDVLPILGQRGAQLWEQLVMSGDINKVSREYHYRVEAGSTRKPNKETQQANINQAIQMFQPHTQWALQNGQIKFVNALTKLWCKAFDTEPKEFLLDQPQPQPNPEMLKIQAEMEQSKQETQLKMQLGQQKMQEDQTKLQLEMRKSEMEAAARQQEMQMDAQAQQQEIALDREKMQSDLQLQQAKGAMDMQMGQIEMGLKLKTEQALGSQKVQIGRQQMEQQAVAGQQKLAMDKEAHKAKLTMAKQQAKAKPKPKGKK